MICMIFDIELKKKESMLKSDMSKFELDALLSKTKIAFRIRRKAV